MTVEITYFSNYIRKIENVHLIEELADGISISYFKPNGLSAATFIKSDKIWEIRVEV